LHPLSGTQHDPVLLVSKGDLLAWINTALHLNLTKVEQAAPGHVACQIMDAI
jgi:RP/EB family microtubule-associated protein